MSTTASSSSAKERSISPSQAAANTLQALSRSPAANAASPPRTDLYSASSPPARSQQPAPFNVRNNSSLLSQSLYSNVGPSSSKSSASNPRLQPPTSQKSPAAAATSNSPLRKELDTVKSSSKTNNSTSPASSKATASKDGTPAKRKKANRACFHCQKAHLTCDDARPCARCVKKGLADSCTDGFRKKAKYLLDDEELEELKRQKEAKSKAKLAKRAADSSSSPAARPPNTAAQSQFQPSAMDQILAASSSMSGTSPAHDLLSREFDSGQSVASHQSEPTFDLTFDPSHNFGSEATSLEYSILSSMLNGTDLALLGPNNGSPDFQTSPAMGILDSIGGGGEGWNVASGPTTSSALETILHPGGGIESSAAAAGPGMTSYADGSGISVTSPAYVDAGASLSELAAGEAGFTALEVPSPAPLKLSADNESGQPGEESNMGAMDDNNSTEGAGTRSASGEPLPADINKEIAARRANRQQQDTLWKSRVAKVYQDNTHPFAYPEGYHFLIKYVTEKFEKQDVLRIVRALAIFRPSLIALQMPLTEEDEVFVERSFQRTILEFEKLISFSGTPTVVWRRTCEICVVGAEFCMLTQWPREELLGRHIYEFMDKNSTLDYWEKFALHAFENTTQSVMTTCTLLTPQGKPVPCAWSFTIKRDIFDLPSLVVGNFLPVLS